MFFETAVLSVKVDTYSLCKIILLNLRGIQDKMPIRKRLTKNNTGSYSITLPKGWIDNIIKTNGKEVKEVLIEVNGFLTIRPVLEEEAKASG